tara:strand:+ start:13432 stop:14022 length:591 start_codon:yes stop_codon:yes gene_type:complete
LKTSNSFPIGLAANWQEPDKQGIADAKLKNWLLDTGSLTERLQSHCRDFRVQVLGQGQTEVSIEEIQQLARFSAVSRDIKWQVREVLLWGNNQPWVFARSIIPEQMCRAEFAGLGNQPLGKLIFNDPRFKRMPFQITQISSSHPITSSLNLPSQHSLWARRSVFQFGGLALSVAELFLPLSPAYAAMSQVSTHNAN